MQRIFWIERLAVLRTGIETLDDLETGIFNGIKQHVAGAQAEVLGDIG